MKLLRNKSKEVAVIELANKMVVEHSNPGISVAAKWKTNMLDKTSVIVKMS